MHRVKVGEGEIPRRTFNKPMPMVVSVLDRCRRLKAYERRLACACAHIVVAALAHSSYPLSTLGNARGSAGKLFFQEKRDSPSFKMWTLPVDLRLSQLVYKGHVGPAQWKGGDWAGSKKRK